MYDQTPVVFETDCVLSVVQMKDISYLPLEAGRISTSFKRFAELMRGLGYEIEEIERLSKIPHDNDLEIVVGARGNY